MLHQLLAIGYAVITRGLLRLRTPWVIDPSINNVEIFDSAWLRPPMSHGTVNPHLISMNNVDIFESAKLQHIYFMRPLITPAIL